MLQLIWTFLNLNIFCWINIICLSDFIFVWTIPKSSKQISFDGLLRDLLPNETNICRIPSHVIERDFDGHR